MLAPIAALLTLGLGAGVARNLSGAAEAAAGRLMDRGAYASRVLEGRATPRPYAGPRPGPRSSPLATLATASAALAVAGFGLFGGRLPRGACAAVGRVVGPAVGVLRGLHSGRVGDYIAWLVVGVAVLGAAMVALTTGRTGP